MAKLHFLAGEAVTSSIELEGELLSIGRTEENDICIEDSSISKNHGCLVRDGNDYQIHDFASANGTHVNGERILAVKLKHGDRIHIGIIETMYDNAPVASVPAGPKIKLSPGAKKLETPQILPVTPVVAPLPPAPAPRKPAGLTLGGKPLNPPAPAPLPPPVKPEPPAQRDSESKTQVPPVEKPDATKSTTSSILKRKSKDDRVFIRIPEKLATPSAPVPNPEPVVASQNITPEPPVFIPMPPTSEPPKPVAPIISVPPPTSSPRPAVNLAETMAVNIRVAPQIEPLSEVPTDPDLSPVPAELLPQPQTPQAPETLAPEPIEEPIPVQPEPASESSATEPPSADRTLKSGPTESKGELRLRPTAPTAEAGEKKIALKPTQAPREQLRFGPKKPQP